MKYMNATELLDFLDGAGLTCSRSSLQKMVRERTIPHYRLPLPTSPPKFLDSDIQGWIKRQKVEMVRPLLRRSKI
jgi:hypothetical protein